MQYAVFLIDKPAYSCYNSRVLCAAAVLWQKQMKCFEECNGTHYQWDKYGVKLYV